MRKSSKEMFERNYRAFGREGQCKISKLKVALIGCGGLGWQIAQQLIGVGVRTLLLIDSDILEITNLNRLPGASFSKVGSPKAMVLSHLLKRMNPNAAVKYMIASVPDSRVMKRLKQYEVIMGGVDSERARSELNRFSVTHLKYYLDGGSGILLEDGNVKHAGGQVNVVIPGISPCLACNHTLDWKMMLYESLDKAEQEIEVKRGYIQGVSEPAPSVVSINGVVASTLVTEFIKLATGLREPHYYTYFDSMATDNLMFKVDVQKNDDCVICSREALFGYGDIVKEDKKVSDLPSFISEGVL